jgi:glycosyltransferase involved in cell wall biosynthesis
MQKESKGRAKIMKISVVTTTLNEEESVEKVINDIRLATANQAEIIVVDSGTDHTAEIAEKLGARVFRVQPKGYGASLKYGFKMASGDVIITTDCDGTYPLEMIPEFAAAIEAGYDVINGSRLAGKAKKKIPLVNRLGNRSTCILLRLLYGIKVTDSSTGMKACRKEVIKSIDWETNCAIPIELLIRPKLAGFKIKEVPIDYRERYGGQTKLKRFYTVQTYLRCIFKYKFKLHFAEDKL